MKEHEDRFGFPFLFSRIHVQPASPGLHQSGYHIRKRTPHQVRILDFALIIRQKASKMGKHIYDESADQILEERPDVVGFSVQCTTYPAAIHISKTIRDRVPDVKIVFGGHNVFFVDKRILDGFSFVECAV